MKKTSIDQVLEECGFSDEENKAFREIISYAKDVQEGKKQNLSKFIKNSIDNTVNP